MSAKEIKEEYPADCAVCGHSPTLLRIYVDLYCTCDHCRISNILQKWNAFMAEYREDYPKILH